MNMTKHRALFFFWITMVLITQVSYSQQCGNCKSTPSIAVYDLDIQVSKPADNNNLELWQKLFLLARYANNYLFQQNHECVRFLLPVYNDETKKTYLKDGVELAPLTEETEVFLVGRTVANVPAQGNLSEFGDYITTGSVIQAGNSYFMHLELQVACTRKTVTSVNVPFQLSSDSKYIEGIAHQAASKLSPLVEKIREFELKERKDRNDFALGGNERGLIKIILGKKTLLPGETTDFTLQLKDCDGQALSGRTISFASSNDALKLPGTIGGIVTPAQVITDAAGKANAKFEMSPAKGQPAIINAHTLTETGKNCMDAFYGSSKVDQLRSFKIEIDYSLNGMDKTAMGSREDGVVLKGGSGRTWNVEYTLTAFYYPPPTQKPDEQIIIMPDQLSQGENVENEPLTHEDDKVEIESLVKKENTVDIEPLINKNGPGIAPLMRYSKGSSMGTSHIYYSGYSKLYGWGKDLSLLASPTGVVSDKAVQYENIISYAPLPPGISMMFKNNDLVFFSCSFDFPPDADEKQPPGGSFGIEINNKKYFPVKAKKNTDPQSTYQWVYELNYKSNDGYNLNNQIYKSEKKELETAAIRIYSTF